MLIRDLSAEEFSRRYGADRFTATVLASRFRYIVEHVCGRLLTAAFSPILRDFYDFAATVTGPPERGLFEYRYKIENGNLLILAGELPTPGSPSASLVQIGKLPCG